MKVSLDWLAELVELPPLETLCEQLIGAGVEVEHVWDAKAAVSGVVVAEVTACEPHPNAESLQVCTVDDGNDRHSVICGAPNVHAGMRAPFAPVGAQLPELSVSQRTIRGVASAGMLCSRAELGLAAASTGLWELPSQWALGADVMAQADPPVVLELAVTPDRPDLLSHLGVAREIAAATGQRLRPPPRRTTEKGPDVNGLARVSVADPKACSRYLARVIRNVTVGPSPRWLREHLELLGQRSINNVVDVTNFVLLELGHPLHAFDLATLRPSQNLPQVRVRRAEAEEVLTTLDGLERRLAPQDLVIADAERPVALAGIMGGANSEVSEHTQDILLESAWFDPTTIRRSAKQHGLRTEASHRFERGADPKILQYALDRCAHLLVEVAGGEVAKGTLDVSQRGEPERTITLSLERIARLLGFELPAERVIKLLEPLEIRCVGRNETALRFEAPSFRPDLSREVDLIEEIARRHGYDAIPERLPSTASAYFFEPIVQRPTVAARHAMQWSGFSEAVHYGFGSPARYEEPVYLLNPLGEEHAALRTSLLPGLLQSLAHNQRHGRKTIRLFELGTTFHQAPARADAEPLERDLPEERRRLAAVLCGGRYDGFWYEGGAEVDFADLAGALENTLEHLGHGHGVDRVPAAREGFNPHACAALCAGEQEVGVAGRVHPDRLRAYEIKGPVFAFELDLSALGGRAAERPKYSPLPRYPGTRRDVAIVAPNDLPAETLRRFLLEHAGGELGGACVESVRLFDVYRGDPIPPTHVSLAFAIFYRSHERTLKDAEVGAAFNGVLAAVKRTFAVEVRE